MNALILNSILLDTIVAIMPVIIPIAKSNGWYKLSIFYSFCGFSVLTFLLDVLNKFSSFSFWLSKTLKNGYQINVEIPIFMKATSIAQ